MKKTLLIVLLLSFGFSQQLIPVVETYSDGNIKSITYHKETRTRIEKVKYREYYENGQKKEEATFKDGKEDGLWTYWYENGQKEFEGTVKDGKEDGLFTRWYENGQKMYEQTYKDGEEEDGKGTYWYENGQKEIEQIFKDGELISQKNWNKDGSVKE